MTSINQLVPALGNAVLEIAPALAKINFDFALYKVDAPKEFKDVGNNLSVLRKERAEEGQPHITARKLGALFESILPHTPELFSAYGLRASDISQAASIDAEGRRSYGIFASQAGVDATTIWAAATSGKGAIASHLLACMLARIWDGPQATSIWMEMIDQRKKEIKVEFDKLNFINLECLSAAKQDISREQIREWDASARAWLRVADSIKAPQQKQLKLIVDNVELKVNEKSATYESVLSAWKSSLSQMEALLTGVSQTAEDGEILLALTSWHLFPDLIVLSPGRGHVRLNDLAFSKGGLITIGLEKSPAHDSTCDGISWSLPLAQLRHYGAPVITTKSLNSTERWRISREEFILACLGSFIYGWGGSADKVQSSIRWLCRISNAIRKCAAAGDPDACAIHEAEDSWFSLMLSAAESYTSKSESDRNDADKLLLLGRRHGKNLLGLANRPLMGLLDKGLYVRFFSAEVQIAHLRDVAMHLVRELAIPSRSIFIRYAYSYEETSTPIYEYATAVPLPGKRARDSAAERTRKHCRWLYDGKPLERTTDSEYYSELERVYPGNKAEQVPKDFVLWHQMHLQNWSGFCLINGRRSLGDSEYVHAQKEYQARKDWFVANDEIVYDRCDQEIEDFDIQQLGIFWSPDKGNAMSTRWSVFAYGDVNSAALFIDRNAAQLSALPIVRSDRVESESLYSLFETEEVKEFELVKVLADKMRFASMDHDPYTKSLKAISTAALLYRNIPHASIDIRVLQQSLYSASWLPMSDVTAPYKFLRTFSALQPYYLDRARAFACLAMFETGVHNPLPSQLSNVMAMSSEDSIYVAEALMCDPVHSPAPYAIRHITGNIGRPGITFLVPTTDPLVRQPQMGDWPQLNYKLFSGERKDCFDATTLHISFTGACMPMETTFSGAKDRELNLLETIVSIHDRGKWIADLDILGSLERALSGTHLPESEIEMNCLNHSESVGPSHRSVCIDNWLELIEGSDSPYSIIRANGNWQARLAATALSVARSNLSEYRTIICGEKLCWACVNVFCGTSLNTKVMVVD
ncbi:hypothetical protein MMC10_002470 [Thelotrema lepadinum]|nr:hypothetical protein [Thelotrema lepadinum]